ncbi:hypothetical protein GCM10011374_30500 [Kocuria dechangensis]|uniref:Uncharacterized protein n=1 Tax=Kocuria dechangensis TaxID=1176249 RepID=A0A917H2I7_9MICC|nr:hypothetical protein [Kocuria dechangensis]GGG64717.1 hypothetical protein GCM10011374_30500 [Kocuria dechangensis]
MTATAVETDQHSTEDTRPPGFRPEPGTKRWQVSYSCNPLSFSSWAIYADTAEQAVERMQVIQQLDAGQRAAAATNLMVRPLGDL